MMVRTSHTLGTYMYIHSVRVFTAGRIQYSFRPCQQKREARLSHRRERERRNRASESAEQRQARLARRRVRDRARRVAQSAALRETALKQRGERLTNERGASHQRDN